jgi:hypothetical protein
VADDDLSQASTTPDQETWPELFRRQVARNTRFWTEQIRTRPVGTPLLHTERDNIVKALNRALQLEAAWATVVDLMVAFHPYMERRGTMARQPCSTAWAR